jgi:hypothetical protein
VSAGEEVAGGFLGVRRHACVFGGTVAFKKR